MPDSTTEEAFLRSWDEVQKFYRNLLTNPGWEPIAPILDLIAALRAKGFDRRLRAGQATWQLVLSRSREHGLRPGQPSVTLLPDRTTGKLFVNAFLDEESQSYFELGHIGVSPGLIAVLLELCERSVD